MARGPGHSTPSPGFAQQEDAANNVQQAPSLTLCSPSNPTTRSWPPVLVSCPQGHSILVLPMGTCQAGTVLSGKSDL